MIAGVGDVFKRVKEVFIKDMTGAAIAQNNLGVTPNTFVAKPLSQKTILQHMSVAEKGKPDDDNPEISSINSKKSKDMVYDGILNGVSVVGELDLGASHAYMSTEAAILCGWQVSKLAFDVELGDKSVVKASGKATTSFMIDNY